MLNAYSWRSGPDTCSTTECAKRRSASHCQCRSSTRGQGPIGEALAAREEAGRKAEGIQAGVLNEIAMARVAYATVLEGLAETRLQLQEAENLLSDAERRFRDAHSIDRPTLLSTQLVALNTRSAELSMLLRAQLELGTLEDAFRRPVAGPELEVTDLAEPVTSRGGTRK